MVRMMTANIQDAINFEGSIRIAQSQAPGPLTSLIKDDYLDFDPSMLQGDIDYLVVDGTLPIEPTRSAETWMNILQVMGQTGLQMEYNTGKILEEAIRSMGVTDLDQYKISKEQSAEGPTPSQKMAMMEASRGASVQPQETIDQELQKGNVIPMSQAQ